MTILEWNNKLEVLVKQYNELNNYINLIDTSQRVNLLCSSLNEVDTDIVPLYKSDRYDYIKIAIVKELLLEKKLLAEQIIELKQCKDIEL